MKYGAVRKFSHTFCQHALLSKDVLGMITDHCRNLGCVEKLEYSRFLKCPEPLKALRNIKNLCSYKFINLENGEMPKVSGVFLM